MADTGPREAAAERLADAAEAVLFFEGDHMTELRAAWQNYVEVVDDTGPRATDRG